jgi:hypothetical protein
MKSTEKMVSDVKRAFKKIGSGNLNNIDIKHTGVSLRTWRCLERINVYTINDLLNFLNSDGDLLSIRNSSKRTVLESIKILEQYVKYHNDPLDGFMILVTVPFDNQGNPRFMECNEDLFKINDFGCDCSTDQMFHLGQRRYIVLRKDLDKVKNIINQNDLITLQSIEKTNHDGYESIINKMKEVI